MSKEWMWRCVKLDESELFFVIAKFLEDGPCERAAKVLREELEEKELLPKSKNWLGEEYSVPFEDVLKRNQHVSSRHLPLVCSELCKTLEENGDCKAKGKHSLIGKGLAKALDNGNRIGTQHSDSTNRLACQKIGYSNGHLNNSFSSNQCFISAARRISTHFNHLACFPSDTYQDMKQHRTVLGHLAPVFCVAFDVTGQRFVSGADDDLIKVWSSCNGSLVATLRGHSAEITDISLSKDNHLIATGSLDKTVRVWCGHTSNPIAVLTGHHGHVTSVQISPSMNEELRYVASTAKDGCLCFWSCDQSQTFSPTPVKFMEKNRVHDQTLCSAFSPGGTFFVTGGTDCIVRVYQCVPYPPLLLAELPGHTDRIMTVQFSNTPTCTFATGSCDGKCRIWKYSQSQWTSMELVDPSIPGDSHSGTGNTKSSSSKGDKVFPPQVTMIGWESTDLYLISAHTPDCHLRVWRTSDGHIVNVLKGHSGEVFVVESHPQNSRILLSAGHDGLIIIWDIIANHKLKTFSNSYEDEGIGLIFDCKWSPDGETVIAADHLGYLTILGFGSSEPYEMIPDEQFFHTDYRPLMRDRNNFVVDEQSQVPPHLLPPPYLVNIDGHPHPLKQQQSILQYIRPADSAGKKHHQMDEAEDYDEYMKKHFTGMKKKSWVVGSGRKRTSEERSGIDVEEGPEVDIEGSGVDIEGSGIGIEGSGVDIEGSGVDVDDLKIDIKGSEIDVEGSNINIEGSGADDIGKPIKLEDKSTTGNNIVRKENGTEEIVDVMEDEGAGPIENNEAGGSGGTNSSIQNMLSSIVYSLGLGDGEVKDAIKNWQCRHILPPLNTDVLCSEMAKLQEMERTEQELYYNESLKKPATPPSPEPAVHSPRGRALRSGRTIPDRDDIISEPLSPLSVGDGVRDETDRDYNNDGWDSASTASSDISDWTAEVGINLTSTSSKRSRRTKIRESLLSETFSDGITIDEEEMAASRLQGGGEGTSDSGPSNEGKIVTRKRKRRPVSSSGGEPLPRRKKTKTLKVSKEVDYTIYWPPHWLRMTSPQLSPYFPQVGDIVVYFRQGHASYRQEVKKEKPYQWKNQQMPWEKYNLKAQELCQVRNVHFVVGPPTLCSITLALLSPSSTSSEAPPTGSNAQAVNQSITFKFKYHDMDGVLDFLVLESVYKSSLKRQWAIGDRFKSFIDGSYWRGTILGREPYHEEFPNSHWQCYHVKWDDGATDQLSPWDMEIPLKVDESGVESEPSTSNSDPVLGVPEPVFPLTTEDEVTAWGSEGEKERIINGLQVVMETMEESEMFNSPVDLEEVYLYCTVVPFPTDLSTISERLKNNFYRRKLALIWDVVALNRNALVYNDPDSVIVEHSKIVSLTLLKFIRSPDCQDPMDCYMPEITNGVESSQEVTAPEMDLLEPEDVFDAVSPPDGCHGDDISPPKTRRKKVLISEEEDTVHSNGLTECAWLDAGVKLLDALVSSDYGYPFLEPVDTVEYSDYLSFVPQPMDLTTIRNKLYDSMYSSIEGFISDIKLVFSNAKCYNKPRSKIYSITTELEKVFEREVLAFFKSCGKEEPCKVEPVKHPYQTRQASERKQLASDNGTLLDSKELTEINVDNHDDEDGGESSKESNSVLNNVGTRQVDKVTRRITRSQTGHKRSNDQYRDTSDDERRESMDGEGLPDTDSITDEGSGVDLSDGTSEEDMKLPSRLSKRRSMAVKKSKRKGRKRRKEVKVLEDEYIGEDGESLSCEDQSFDHHRRRSSRIRSSVAQKRLKMTSENEEEEMEYDETESSVDMESDTHVYPLTTTTTSRMGRVIKPTVRYS